MKKKHSPKKRFGQNFLIDQHYIDRLISTLALRKNNHVVEIGPGKGALTEHVVPRVEHYDAIEIDRDLITCLEKKFSSYSSFHLYNQDALKFNFANLHQKKPMRVIGNLPYNIASPLLFHLFTFNTCIQDMHFMLQKEVSERITANTHTSQYGRLSVMTQYFCQVKLLFLVPKSSFAPQPNVMSAFCQFIPKPSTMLTAKNETVFATIVKEAFTYRRKMLANSLKKYLTTKTLHTLGIDSTRRAETLSVGEFVKISNAICTK